MQVFLLQACSSAPAKGQLISTPLSKQQLNKAINKQYTNWKGVRYKMGGLQRNGIDCSGLIYRVFNDGMGIKLPRSTERQSRIGYTINKSNLQVGDLVFFKTGGVFKSRHVGIYTGNNQFLHASTSKGVMKSSLTNPYWKETYWHSRRILK